MHDAIQFLLIAAGLILGLYVTYWFFVALPADMATERNRDSVAWVLVSIFASPFLAIFLLWMLGDAEEGQ